jgi:hypothetical protein
VVARLHIATLIIDVEPLVVPWDAIPAAFLEGAMRLQTAVAAGAPSVTDIIFASNSRKAWPPVPKLGTLKTTLVRGARKPWRTRYVRGRPSPIAVLGDQVLTDGLLAWRLHADFVHVTTDLPVPWWPRTQAAIGHLLVPVLYVDPPAGGDSEHE